MEAVTRGVPPSDSSAGGLRWFGPGPWPDASGPGTATDVLFLAAIVLLSSLPYMTGLGLYSDDWAFLSAMYEAGGPWPRLLAAVMPIEMATRPVQAIVLATLYALFGTDPLGYHVFNAFVLTGAVVLFHLSLRAMGFARLPAMLVPLIFGLLPHYSTDRVWIAAFQANVSVLLYFVSLYTDLRFLRGAGAVRWAWKALGSVALAASVLAYEVTAPLLLLNVVLLSGLAYTRRGPQTLRRVRPSIAGIASNVLVLAAAIGYKLSTTVRADISGGYVYRVLRVVREAVPVHFGEYGVELPLRVVQVLRGGADAGTLVVALVIGLFAALWLFRAHPDTSAEPGHGVSWPALMLLGVLVFFVGYGVTLMTWEIGFHATGANNRTAIAAALGVAFVFVGGIGWISGLLPQRAGRATFAAVIGILAASCVLITGTVAATWVQAAREQEIVVTTLRERSPELAAGSTLLLDGLCPYVGPAPVFATSWDVTGMLQLEYDERDLRGDVIKPNTEVTPAGLRTMLFDDVINVYPYGADLIVLHVGSGRVFRLDDAEAARNYLATVSAESRAPCPPYTDGDGADMF